MTDELKPVLDPERPRNSKAVNGHWLTKTVRAATGTAGALGIIICAFYFLGFAENDQGVLHLLSAFALCFGIGALFYLPTFFIARKAHIFLRSGARPRQGRQIIAIILPWPVLAFYFAQLGGPWALISAIIFALTLLCGCWGFYISKRRN